MKINIIISKEELDYLEECGCSECDDRGVSEEIGSIIEKVNFEVIRIKKQQEERGFDADREITPLPEFMQEEQE